MIDQIDQAVREVLSNPALGMADLLARLDALLPGDGPLINRTMSSGGWQHVWRWIGRADTGVELTDGLAWERHSTWSVVISGIPGQDRWPASDAENERLNSLIRGDL